MSRVLNVAYASDDNYAALTGVSLYSLLESNRALDGIHIYILDSGISAENKARFFEMMGEFGAGRELTFIDTAAELEKLAALKITPQMKTSYVTYSRLLAPELIPDDIDRLFYLDGDTLIVDSLEELLSYEFGGASLAMAYDCTRSDYKQVIGLPADKPYYNAGNILYDVRLWKSRRCTGRMIDHLRDVRATYPLVDQDVLNLVLQDEIAVLGCRYDLLSHYFLHEYEDLLRVYHLSAAQFYGRGEVEAARAAPAIYHFSGRTLSRPWYSNSLHPRKALYDNYYRRSPWGALPQQPMKLPLPYAVQLFGYRHLPKRLFVLQQQLMLDVFFFLYYRESRPTKAHGGVDA